MSYPQSPKAADRWFTGHSQRLGLNYTPGLRWYYFWNDFREVEVAGDLHAMRALGIDHIRLQLIWPWFMPNPGWVSPGHLDRLDRIMALAADQGLDVLVSVLTGFLSGYVFLPWGVTGREVFTNPSVLEQEASLFGAVLDRIGDRPNLMGLDLGNEINCLDHELPIDQGDSWGRAAIGWVRRHGKTPVVNGVDHSPWISGTTFSLDHLGHDYDACCLHIWPAFTGCLERGPLDGGPSLDLTSFMIDLARLHTANGMPIWVQESGCCDLWGDIGARRRFMQQAISDARTGGAGMFTWWCSHDKIADLAFNRQEYRYGLLTPDNRPKPLAGMFRECIEQWRADDRRDTAGASSAGVEPDRCRLILPDNFKPRIVRPWSPGAWLEQNFASNTWDVFDQYRRMRLAGLHPRLTWASEAGPARAEDQHFSEPRL
ncbi:MAG: hypothetical protein JJU36_05055 [Phycisphaeraceae bacterium]|nr:hypothetical protein [Phycisphaeraceae bacterium]